MKNFIDDIYDQLRSARTSGYHDGRYNMGYDDALDYAIAALEMLIVRCKDCKHYGWTENRIPSEREWWCYEWDDAREETDFCSHAERREDLK